MRGEGRRARTITANVEGGDRSLLYITTRDASGWWLPLVKGEIAILYARCRPQGVDAGLAYEHTFVVEGLTDDTPPTLVEASGDLGRVLRGYGQNPDEVLAKLVELYIDLLG